MGFFDLFKDTIGIDPGSENLRLIHGGKIVFNQRSQLSIDTTRMIVSVLGDSLDPTSDEVIIKPINCVISDFQGFEMLLRGAIKKSINPKFRFPRSYRIYYTIPTSSTEIEKRAYRDSAEHAGAVEVYMINESYCSAIALNLLFDKQHFILIGFGASKVEIAVFANSEIISLGVIRFGTWKICRILKNYFRREYKIVANDNEIHDLLRSLLLASDSEVTLQHTRIAIAEITVLLQPFFNLINDEFLETIESVSHHADIKKALANGVYFTGGGSAFEFLRNQIKIDDAIKKAVSKNPFLDNVNGLAEVVSNPERFRKYLMV